MTYWLGTDDSIESFRASVDKASAYKARVGQDALDKIKLPPLYNRQGNVGVIEVTGHLISGSSGWMRLFGIVGYDDIKAAVLDGIKDRSADKLMLYGKSGGGAVDGVSSMAHMLRSAAAVKPMNAYADFTASACYWLLSAAPHITLADTGIAGSIGILKIHREISQAEKKEGTTTTVMRAGKHKAELNPYEPLSEQAKAEEQKKLDHLYNTFIQTVAHQRGGNVATIDKAYGQGRTFIGTMALDVGIVDAIGDVASALAYAKDNDKKLDASKVSFTVTKTPSAD